MSDGTKIQWTDASWNPVTGCTKVSPGCAHCYIVTTPAFRIAGRKFSDGSTDIRFHEARMPQPLSWRRPRRIFVNSLSDLFHEAIPDEFIARVYGVMVAAYWHEFQVLTKRPERRLALLRDARFREMVALEAAPLIHTLRGRDPLGGEAEDMRRLERWEVAEVGLASWNEGAAPNIWEGVTAENQRWAGARIPVLLDTPAAVRFISAEPLLGPLQLEEYLHDSDCWARFRDPPAGLCICNEPREEHISWVIVGGESGPGARPCDLDWIRDIVRQCQAACVAVFVKQLGAKPREHFLDRGEWPVDLEWCGSRNVPPVSSPEREPDWWAPVPSDRKGGDPAEWPEDLRVREMPR